jgi:hypothetical protein
VTAPTLEAVLAAFRPGRVVPLQLTREQKKALRHVDGRIALDVLRHRLGARAAVQAPERFPLTEQTIQAFTRKLGHKVGQKRCRELRRRLEEAGVIPASGHYRQLYRNSAARSGFCVSLFKLARRLPSVRQGKHPVGKRRPVKRRDGLRWWQHPLFGDYSGLPPPGISRSRLRKVRLPREGAG